MQDSAGPQFVLSGYRDGTSTYDHNVRGNYWSSSADTSATYAYDLYLRGTDSTVGPAGGNYKRRAFTLRCLAQ